jgi:predicted membrane protein
MGCLRQMRCRNSIEVGSLNLFVLWSVLTIIILGIGLKPKKRNGIDRRLVGLDNLAVCCVAAFLAE